MTTSTFNAPTLASTLTLEDLIMQTRRIRHDVMALAETRSHLFNDVHDTGEELLFGGCDST